MKSILFASLFLGGVFGCSKEDELHTKFASLPPTSAGPKIGPSGYYVESYGKGAYSVTDGSYQALFLVSTDGVILVDLPPTIGKNMLYAIGNITDAAITHIVYSHSHSDHIGSAVLAAGKGVEIIAHADTKELIANVHDPLRPLPTKTFAKDHRLTVGNQTLELSYKGENHVRGNIYIYAPAQKILMLVDVVFPGWVPFSQLGVATNLPGFIQAHDDILEYDFEHYIGGHLDRTGNRTDVLVQREYVQDLFNNCNASIALSTTNDPIVGAQGILDTVTAQNPGNAWAEFKIYLDIVSEYCSNMTNEKWLGKLGAADVFGFDNAYTMVEHLRLDYNQLGPFRNN